MADSADESVDYSKVALRAVDIVTDVRRARLARARDGRLDSFRVGVPWRDFLALVDALEEASPGWIDRVYDLKEEARG